ncbi:MAG: nuclear transport factor 2 family protein [Verrucomicrobia bacterium]|nr:nuclear transport factor 2 family protein [Verrucomicrobiota bacterium]MCH8512965.1 hypothetical protein [Kiritimatiellia bacterium]
MKMFLLGAFVMFLMFLGMFVGLDRFGREPRHDAAGTNAQYRGALALSAERAANPPVGGTREAEWIQKVQDAFSPFSVENVSTAFPEAYAEEFYFRDAFHVFTELEPMLAYMVKTAEASPGVTFEYEAPARRGPDFYLPWVMVLPLRGSEKEQRSIGMSHLRFNEEGKVIFHQDYWDSSDVLVERVPVANGLIEWVRRRF